MQIWRTTSSTKLMGSESRKSLKAGPSKVSTTSKSYPRASNVLMPCTHNSKDHEKSLNQRNGSGDASKSAAADPRTRHLFSPSRHPWLRRSSGIVWVDGEGARPRPRLAHK